MNNDILVIINWYEENINNLDHALERLNEVFKNIIICRQSYYLHYVSKLTYFYRA